MMNRLDQAKKFFEGKLSTEEAAEFSRWYLSEEGEEYLRIRINQLWVEQSKHSHRENWDSGPLFKKILTIKENQVFLHPDNSPEFVPTSRKDRKGLFFRVLKIAAVISLTVVAISVLLYRFQPYSGTKTSEDLALITKSNPAGQKSRIQLPDGSTVFLNAESLIAYSKNFQHNRRVALKGEAFFEVKTDSLHPFSVATGRLVTTALGTSFNINAFDEDAKLEVILVSGKVKVEDKITKGSLLLDPNESVKVQGVDPAFEKRTLDNLAETFWRNGIIWFSETPFQEVVTALERWYDVDFAIAGEPREFRCSGKFENQSLEEVLESLSYTAGFEFAIENKQVKLIFN